jgi:hypothetical protein
VPWVKKAGVEQSPPHQLFRVDRILPESTPEKLQEYFGSLSKTSELLKSSEF